MEAAASRLKSQRKCTRINQCQHAILTIRARHEEWSERVDADGI